MTSAERMTSSNTDLNSSWCSMERKILIDGVDIPPSPCRKACQRTSTTSVCEETWRPHEQIDLDECDTTAQSSLITETQLTDDSCHTCFYRCSYRRAILLAKSR